MVAKTRRATLALVLALAVAGGCRPASGPSPAVADDIDAIERALADRDHALAAEGIVVAYRGPRAAASPSGGPGALAPGLEAAAKSQQDDAPAEVGADGESASLTTAPTAKNEERSVNRERADSGGAAPTRDHRRERLCRLAETTCELRDRICQLATRHLGDPRYVLSCGRAEDQCVAVQQRCDAG